jgi:hypothetical protein
MPLSSSHVPTIELPLLPPQAISESAISATSRIAVNFFISDSLLFCYHSDSLYTISDRPVNASAGFRLLSPTGGEMNCLFYPEFSAGESAFTFPQGIFRTEGISCPRAYRREAISFSGDILLHSTICVKPHDMFSPQTRYAPYTAQQNTGEQFALPLF